MHEDAILTPVEIAEYKMRWMSSGNNNPVGVHSDLRHEAKAFCKDYFNQHEYVHNTWTDVYEDTFFFESVKDANFFRNKFKKWLTSL